MRHAITLIPRWRLPSNAAIVPPAYIVLVVHRDEVVYRKAFGHVSLQPEKKPLSVEAVYDLASLTKPIATAASIWILVEQGKLSLSDKVAKHWPAFAANKKDAVTIEQLLLHTSGLTADNPVGDYKDGKSKALERIAGLSLEAEPGTRFRYSDVGYIVLGQIVERTAGESIGAFARKRIFEPLKMTSTGYKPSGTLKDRCIDRPAFREVASSARFTILELRFWMGSRDMRAFSGALTTWHASPECCFAAASWTASDSWLHRQFVALPNRTRCQAGSVRLAGTSTRLIRLSAAICSSAVKGSATPVSPARRFGSTRPAKRRSSS